MPETTRMVFTSVVEQNPSKRRIFMLKNSLSPIGGMHLNLICLALLHGYSLHNSITKHYQDNRHNNIDTHLSCHDVTDHQISHYAGLFILLHHTKIGYNRLYYSDSMIGYLM
jgi:hypothetical protein